MKLTLDAGAVRALIDNSPEFEAELRRCVISEIVKKTLLKDANRFDAIVQKEIARQGSQMTTGGYNGSHVNLTNDGLKRMNEAVDRNLKERVEEIVGNREAEFLKVVKEAEDKYREEIAERVDKRFDNLMNRYFERDVNAEVARRIQIAADVTV